MLRTNVNGEKRRESGIDDLIFDVSAMVRFFSNGHTLRRGSLIMTRTPFGDLRMKFVGVLPYLDDKVLCYLVISKKCLQAQDKSVDTPAKGL